MNLPEQLDVGSNKRINYFYNSTGEKMLQAVSENGSTPEMTYYFGPFVHEGIQNGTSSLKYIMTPEGRILNTGTDNAPVWNWEYYLKDHLGNVRVVIEPTSTPGYSNVLQENHYYPFGMRMSQLSSSANSTNKYLFGGKLLDNDFGLNWYDFGGRGNYNAPLCVWHSIDPMAEKNYGWTPYRYGFDNPLRFWDVGGNFEMDRIQAQQYKNLAQYLRSGIQGIANNSKVMNALMKYGQFSKEDILNDLKWGNGPKVNITSIKGAFGEFTPDIGSKEIRINEKYIKQLESATGEDKDLLLFIIAVKILHEYTHYGDDQDGIDYVGSVGNKEEGDAFELTAYGKIIHVSNAGIILDNWKRQKEQDIQNEENKEKQNGLNNLINNFDNLQEGEYRWNGSSWVKE
jgi:RHS repeat-associated protein